MTSFPPPPPPPPQSAPPPLPRRSYRASRLIGGFVGLTLVVMLGLLVVGTLKQQREERPAEVLEAPTPSPLAAASAESGGMPAGGGGTAFPQRPPGGHDAGRIRETTPGAISGGPGLPPSGWPAELPAGAPVPQLPPPTPRPPAPTPTPSVDQVIRCSEGIYFDVNPEQALVTINGEPVGEAKQWSRSRNAFRFPRAGVYFVGLSAPGRKTEWIRVTVEAGASETVVKVAVRLADLGRDRLPAAAMVVSEGIYFDVEPDNALVTINGSPLGEAKQWSRRRNAYTFAAAGVYRVELSCRGCRTATFTVTVDPGAAEKVAKIEAELEE